MSRPNDPHPVEVFEIAEAKEGRALVALKRPNDVVDVPPEALVGAVSLKGGVPKWDSLELMERFKALHGSYMRGELRLQPEILTKAQVNPGEYVYVIDGRVADPMGNVPFEDIIGWYKSDEAGRAIPDTFEHNADHHVVAAGVPSSMLLDPRLRALAFGMAQPSALPS